MRLFLIRNYVRNLFIAVLVISGNIQIGLCQQSSGDYFRMKQLYDSSLNGTSFIHTGPEYAIPNFRRAGTPFFPVDSLVEGSIYYNGYQYTKTPLMWDVMNNYVLTSAGNGFSKIILRNDLIDSFSFAGHHVVKLFEDKKANLYNTDFYDVLSAGVVSVYARRQKTTYQQIDNDKIVYHFRDNDKFYIRKDGVFYRVSNRREVLNVLAKYRNVVNKEVNKSGLNWRKDFESCLIIAAESINELK